MKKAFYIIGTLLFITICVYFYSTNNFSKVVITNETEERKMNTNALTMMYETEAGSGEYMVSSDSTWPIDGYTFNERLSGCENGSKLTWNDEKKVVILSTTVSDKCYVYFDVKVTLLTDYIIGLYTTDGENNLYYHDADLTNGAEDKSYRYSGVNPNNYVCFQTNDDVCSEDNLYQIIGLYYNPEKSEYNVKLSANNIFGVSFDLSNFRNSLLDLINNTLNNDYLNTISEISSKIANYTWHLNEVPYPYSAKQAYNAEFNNSEDNLLTEKIGLLYASDILYAELPDQWSKTYNNLTTSNWLIERYCQSYFTEYTEVLMDNATYSGDILTLYWISGNSWMITDTDSGVRPDSARAVFYLNSNVKYISGDGSKANPYIIN